MKAERIRDKPTVRLSRDLQARVVVEADQRGVTRNAMLETFVMLGMSAYVVLESNSTNLQTSTN